MLWPGYFIHVLLSLVLILSKSYLVTLQKVQPRIIGGRISSIKQAKFLVQVLSEDELCGGSLVTSLWVITAAHCVLNVNPKDFRIYGGASNIEGRYGISRRVTFVASHPDFTQRTFNMDVAALKLNQPMIGPNIQTIDLATQQVPPRTVVTVYGWGLLNENDDDPPLRVHSIKVPVWSRTACRRIYKGVLKITRSMFCAAKPRARDSCAGDSGGPLVFQGKLLGIVSWGTGCATRYPGVYTNVPAIRKWFLHIVKIHS